MHKQCGVSGQDDGILDRTSVNSNALVAVLLVAIGLVVGACGSVANNVDLSSPTQTQDSDCVPDDVAGLPLTSPDRRIEDMVEAMTGERQTGDEDPVEETIDDPNFGGVWGDFQGGVVVAVLDCSKVEANELARIAGGSEYLHLIEVPYTFKQVDGFRDALVQELRTLGVAGDVFIESTPTGRHIEVHVLDPERLPDAFGAEIPADAFTVVVTGELVTRQ